MIQTNRVLHAIKNYNKGLLQKDHANISSPTRWFAKQHPTQGDDSIIFNYMRHLNDHDITRIVDIKYLIDE